MRELVYYIAVSIDGHIAAPDGAFDRFLMEGDHAPQLTEEFTDAIPGVLLDAMGVRAPLTRFDTVIMGWDTYTLDPSNPNPYPHLRQIVASSREREVHEGIEVTSDPVARVRELKAEDGAGIYLCGGGGLAGTLIEEIDRLVLKRNPLAFGDGIPLFGHAPYRPVRFDPVGVRVFGSGVVVEEYVRAPEAAA